MKITHTYNESEADLYNDKVFCDFHFCVFLKNISFDHGENGTFEFKGILGE